MGIYREANTGHVEAIGFGAVADGIVDNASFLSSADAAGYPIFFTSGVYRISTNVALLSPLTFQPGAMLSIDSGITLTLAGSIDAGPWKIFTGSGSVVFSKGQQSVLPQWWNDPISTDMASAINKASASLASTGGIVKFVPGNYACVGAISSNVVGNITYLGDRGAILTATTTAGLSIFQVTSGQADSFTIDGLTFASTVADAQAIAITGANNYGEIFIRNITTLGIHGINAVKVSHLVVEHSKFFAKGVTGRIAVSATDSCNLKFRKNRFHYMMTGLDISGYTSTAEFSSHNIQILDNDFDGGWYTLKPDFTGGTCTYTATTLTDGGASFSGITVSPNATHVRALPVLRTGTGTFTRRSVSDAGATFISSGVKRGYVVKAGSKFAIVTTVETETLLWIDEWLDSSTYLPTTIPSGSYSVHRVILGKISGFTSTVVTVGRWWDFSTGATVLPATNTLYEITKAIGVYQVVWGANGVICSRNTVRRAYADEISSFGTYCTISDNLIEDGQDMGITVQNGIHCTITGNVVRHSGTGNIVIHNSFKCVVDANTLTDCGIYFDSLLIGNIYVIENSKSNIISNNQCSKVESTGSGNRAIHLQDSNTGDGYVELNIISNNRANGYSAGLTFTEDGSAVRNNYWYDNIDDDPVRINSAVAGPLRSLTNYSSGIYIPDVDPVSANINSITVRQFQYLRLGKTVTVSGRIDIDFDDTATTVVNIELPVPSDFGAGGIGACSGVAVGIDVGTAYPAGSVIEDAGTDRAELHLESTGTAGTLALAITFTYAVQP